MEPSPVMDWYFCFHFPKCLNDRHVLSYLTNYKHFSRGVLVLMDQYWTLETVLPVKLVMGEHKS